MIGLLATLLGFFGLSAAPAKVRFEPPEEVAALPVSVVATEDRVLVYREPRRGAERRGTVAGGYRMPVFRAEPGSGCASLWFELHSEGWVCGDHAATSTLPPDAPALPELDDDVLTPFPYGFVREGGAPLFERLTDVAAAYSERWLEQGFAVSVQRRLTYAGERLYRSAGGAYVRASDVYLARPSAFQGTEIDGPEDIGWTFGGTARLQESLPGSGGDRGTTLERQTLLHFVAEHQVGRRTWLEVEGGGFIRDADVRRPEYVPPPEGVGPYDRWFDVDRSRQVLVAYEGSRPVYATLVSTGRQNYATPQGTFRIWVKLISDRMANEMPEDPEESPYYLEDVPWVAYFNDDIALHGAYWHRAFGTRKSHGCVNLAPIDAKWVFDFARPSLPRGWWSISATESDAGSIVVVR